MTFFNDTNKGRVQKIMEILALISKSGNSNGADREHYQDLLEPVIQAMAELSPAVGDLHDTPAPEPDQQKARSHPMSLGEKHVAPQWVDVRDMARNAPLNELGAAMYVFLDRVDQELLETK